MKSLKNTEKTASFKNKYVTHNDVASYDTKNDLKKKKAISTKHNRSISGEKCFPTHEILFVSFIVAITPKVSLI